MLYLEHFGLDEPPFRITPHTDFFFDGADRGATLDALLYAILQDEGIVKVSGEVGSGKTMLCRVLMERLPEHVEIVYLANPSLARDEILRAIADDLKVEFSEGRITVALRELEECLIALYAKGRRVVILIDEAHAMPEETLEQVRLLSNLESNRHKLLQIVLFGQTELETVLDKISMRQLKDRITHSFRMRPLSEQEVGTYISFRMRAAGYRGPNVFSGRAVSMIAKAASGLTRRVNILADKALLAAFTENKHAVTDRQVRAAIKDSEFGRLLHERPRNPFAFAAIALLAGLALGAAFHWWLSQAIDAPGRTPIAVKPPPLPAAPQLPTPPPDASSPVPPGVAMPASAPESGPEHCVAMTKLALAMHEITAREFTLAGHPLQLRIGIASGPVIAGVVGTKKFIYDVWGDTVNVASRVTGECEPGRIQVDERTHARLSGIYAFEAPRTLNLKGKGYTTVYQLVPAAPPAGHPFAPNI